MDNELTRRIERLERLMLIPSQRWNSFEESVPPEGHRVLLYMPISNHPLRVAYRKADTYLNVAREVIAETPLCWMHINYPSHDDAMRLYDETRWR